MTRFLSFHWQAIKEAGRGCVAAANDWQWLVGFPLLGVIIYLVNRWIGQGALTLSPDTVLGALGAAFIAFLITLAVVFLIKWVNAPVKLYYELKDKSETEIAALKHTILDREARQAAMARLWVLRKEGVELRNEAIAMPGFPDWKRRYEHWHSKVIADAKLVSPNLCAWLDTLDQVRPPPALLPRAACEEHRLLRDCQSEILRRMQEFLQAEMLHRDIEEIQAGAGV
jgi:hypothetical protein